MNARPPLPTGRREPRVSLGCSGRCAQPILAPAGTRSALVTLPARTGKTRLALHAARHWTGPVFLLLEEAYTGYAEPAPSKSDGLLDALPFRLRDLPASAPGDWLFYEAPGLLAAGHKVVLDASWCQHLGTTLSDGLQGLLHELARIRRSGPPILVILDGLGHHLPAVDLPAVQRAAALIPDLTLLALTRAPSLLGEAWVRAAAQSDLVLVHELVRSSEPRLADLLRWDRPGAPDAAHLSTGTGPVDGRQWSVLPQYTPVP